MRACSAVCAPLSLLCSAPDKLTLVLAAALAAAKRPILMVGGGAIASEASKEVVALVQRLGGEVAAVASLVDRSNGKVDFGVKFVNLISMDIVSYEPDDCPLCKEGKLELVKPGSRVFAK